MGHVGYVCGWKPSTTMSSLAVLTEWCRRVFFTTDMLKDWLDINIIAHFHTPYEQLSPWSHYDWSKGIHLLDRIRHVIFHSERTRESDTTHDRQIWMMCRVFSSWGYRYLRGQQHFSCKGSRQMLPAPKHNVHHSRHLTPLRHTQLQ